MATNPHGLDQGEAAEAFAAVLAAEQAAEQAVAACVDRADQRLALARQEAAALRAHALALSERWTLAQARRSAAYADAIEMQIAALTAPDAEATRDPRPHQAAARVADELIGDQN